MKIKDCVSLWLFSVFLALFLLRDPSFIDNVPQEHRADFVDSHKLAPYKLKILKKMVQDRFPVSTALQLLYCLGAGNLFCCVEFCYNNTLQYNTIQYNKSLMIKTYWHNAVLQSDVYLRANKKIIVIYTTKGIEQ